MHHAGCNCAEEMKQSDPTGVDLFPCILSSDIECFNEKDIDSIQKVIRPYERKTAFRQDPSLTMQADMGTELVVKIPFNSEVKVKAICVAGGNDGDAPSKMKVYKNEENVDFSILEDKRPVQTIDLAENSLGEIDYPVNLSKFNNCQNIVLGFEGNFGGSTSIINFIGLKGAFIREKSKATEFIYEVRANIADHQVPGEDRKNDASLGM